MAEVDLESDQIRLKCIRKEGFFTVPPEHRVRRGATRAALSGRARLKRTGAFRVAFKFEVPASEGERQSPSLPRRGQKSAAQRLGRGGTEDERPRARRVGGSRWHLQPRGSHLVLPTVLSLLCDVKVNLKGLRFLLQ